MSAEATRSLVVVTAGLSEPSSSRLLADRLAAAVERHLREAGLEPRLEVIELRDHAMDLANQMLTGFPTPSLQAALDAVLAADGVIAVTPIFSGSYNGLFKLFFDVIDRDGFRAKPVADRRDRRDAAALAGDRTRDAPALRLPPRRGRPDRRLRRDRGLGPRRGGHRRQPRRADRASRHASSPRRWRARPFAAPRDEFADPVPFEDLLRH